MKRCYSCMQWVEDDGAVDCPYCSKPIKIQKKDRLDLRPGSMLQGNRYEIGRSLGRGGNGVTYIAVEHLRGTTERICAIKECFPKDFCLRINDEPMVRLASPGYQQSFSQALQRFREEVLFLESLKSYPCVVRYLNQFYENGTMYLVMEYADKTLTAQMYAKDGVFSVGEALENTRLVLRALRDLHSIQYPGQTGTSTILHRDICMDNLCLFTLPDGQTTAKLIDFGSSALVSEQEGGKILPRSRKAGYTSPEQYRNEYQDTYSDVYSVAMVLYKMLCGHCPDETDEERISHAVDIHKVRPDVPQWLRDIIIKATEPDPKDRYQTAEEFLTDLEMHENPDKKQKTDVKKIASLVAALLLAGVMALLAPGGEEETVHTPVVTATPVPEIIQSIALKNDMIYAGDDVELIVSVSYPTEMLLLLNGKPTGEVVEVAQGQTQVVLTYSSAKLNGYVYDVGVRYRDRDGTGVDYPQHESLRIMAGNRK